MHKTDISFHHASRFGFCEIQDIDPKVLSIYINSRRVEYKQQQ